MNKIFIVLIFFISNFLFAKEDLPSIETQDLIFNKLDQQTPTNINDDHIIIRKITAKDINNLAVSAGNIYFEQDKYQVNATEMLKVEEIAKAILSMEARIEKILIAGFSDETADPLAAKNKLAFKRAKSIEKELINLRVPSSMITSSPISTNPAFQYKNINKNRRVDIIIKLKSNQSLD